MKKSDVGTSQRGSGKGLVILMLFLLAAFVMGAIASVKFLLPSLATDAASALAKDVVVYEPVATAVGSGSVITTTFDELLAHDQEIHQHDETMNQAALDAVVDVAKSGDVAQGVIAATGDVASAVQGFAMLGVAVAMAVIVYLVISKK